VKYQPSAILQPYLPSGLKPEPSPPLTASLHPKFAARPAESIWSVLLKTLQQRQSLVRPTATPRPAMATAETQTSPQKESTPMKRRSLLSECHSSPSIFDNCSPGSLIGSLKPYAGTDQNEPKCEQRGKTPSNFEQACLSTEDAGTVTPVSGNTPRKSTAKPVKVKDMPSSETQSEDQSPPQATSLDQKLEICTKKSTPRCQLGGKRRRKTES